MVEPDVGISVKGSASMSDKDAKHDYEQWGMKNWRAWGSWFSWGSPVGLGLFFVLLAGAVWILAHLSR